MDVRPTPTITIPRKSKQPGRTSAAREQCCITFLAVTVAPAVKRPALVNVKSEMVQS